MALYFIMRETMKKIFIMLSLALVGCGDIEERCGDSYDTGTKATVNIECEEENDNSSSTVSKDQIYTFQSDVAFVSVGEYGIILSSENGVNWIPQISNTTKDLYSVSNDNNTYVAVGAEGTIQTSSDGVTWYSRTSDTTKHLYGVTYGNGYFIVVGQDGIILKSPNGITWTRINSENKNNLMEVTYGNNTFVAVGLNGTILTSTNIDKWISRESLTNTLLTGVSYGDDTFVVVGWNKTIRTSADGITWNNISNGTSEDVQLEFVVYKNDLFSVVGSNGNMIISLDSGESWNQITSQTSSYLYGVTYGNELWVAVGELGTIYNSNGVNVFTGMSNTFLPSLFRDAEKIILVSVTLKL